MVGFLYPPTGVAVCERDVRPQSARSQQLFVDFSVQPCVARRMLARANWTSVTDACWLRFRRVAGLELGHHRLQGKAAAAKEYEQVEEQVCGL